MGPMVANFLIQLEERIKELESAFKAACEMRDRVKGTCDDGWNAIQAFDDIRKKLTTNLPNE